MKRIFRIPYWGLLVIPTLIGYVGAGLNKIVMAFNGGQMPALFPGGPVVFGWDAASDPNHCVMTHASRLRFFADWINLHTAIVSPGDLLNWISAATIAPCFYAWIAIVLVYLIGE